MGNLQNRTAILSEENESSWKARQGYGNVTQIERKKDEVLNFTLYYLTNSASSIGQGIAAELYNQGLLSTSKEEDLVKIFYVDTFDQYPNSELDTANSQRIYLLAKKYENEKISNEDNARLEILKARVERMFPSISIADYEGFDKIASDLGKIMEEDADIRKEFDL